MEDKKKIYISICIVSLLIFLIILFFVLTKPEITTDVNFNNALISIRSSPLTGLMNTLTSFGDIKYLGLASLALILIFIYKKSWRYAFLVFFAMGVGAGLQYFIKLFVQRMRPDNALIEDSTFSFPSGHAMMALIFFALILYIFAYRIKGNFVRFLFIFIDVALILAVGFSRLYLGVHWLSDVVAGFALGMLWLSFSILLSKEINF